MRNLRTTALMLALLGVAACNNDIRQATEAHQDGLNLLQQGAFSRAVKKLETAVTIKPDQDITWYQLGEVHYKQKNIEKAIDAYTEAVKYRPDDAMYQAKLGQALFEGFDSGEGGSLELAETSLQKAIELNDKLYKVHHYLGRVYDRRDKPAEAAAAWTKAATLNPYFGEPFVSLGKLYLRWDFVPQAIAVLEQGSLHVKDPREATKLFFNLGLAYDSQKNWDKAIEAYTKAIDKRGDNFDARLQRAFSLFNKGEKTKARDDLQEYVAARKGNNDLKVQVANELLMKVQSM